MKYIALGLLTLSVFACKKKHAEIPTYSLSETNWSFHFKNNPTFTYYALSHLYFKNDHSVINYRSVDTVSGTWSQADAGIEMQFDNGEKYSGYIITSDSLSGTSVISGNNGSWYAIRR